MNPVIQCWGVLAPFPLCRWLSFRSRFQRVFLLNPAFQKNFPILILCLTATNRKTIPWLVYVVVYLNSIHTSFIRHESYRYVHNRDGTVFLFASRKAKQLYDLPGPEFLPWLPNKWALYYSVSVVRTKCKQIRFCHYRMWVSGSHIDDIDFNGLML